MNDSDCENGIIFPCVRFLLVVYVRVATQKVSVVFSSFFVKNPQCIFSESPLHTYLHTLPHIAGINKIKSN